jgi:enediyne biosynthesis protein E7
MPVTQCVAAQAPSAAVQFDIGATDDSLARMRELFVVHGDIYRVYSPSRQSYSYVIHHPDDIKRVLVSNHRNYTKGIGLDRVKILLGNGIMTSEGEFWRCQRYMMQPLFHRRVMHEFALTIAQANDRLLTRWESHAGQGNPINLTDEMSELTLEVVLQAIFGRDLKLLTQQLGANPFEVLTAEPARNLQFAYRFRSLGKWINAVITRRREHQEEHYDYLGMLMNARDKDTGSAMSDRALLDEVLTLIVAGHETTASGLNWAWYLLSQHDAALQRLQDEVDMPPTLETLDISQSESLVYTRQVIDEALRLYPPGWLLSRRAREADVLCGYDIPAGSDVLLSPFIIHRHPSFWNDTEQFMPERFDAAASAKRPRFAYLPFAAGPRHCIGETFALYEMLVHFYKVARHFRMSYVADRPLELEAQINLRSKYPIHMRLERR